MRRSFGLIVTSLVLVSLPVVSQAAGEVEIRVLSNRADLVSGGDALVEIVLPDGETSAEVSVDTIGDVGAAFALRGDGRYMGRIEGMPQGPNVVTATSGGTAARLTITNHSIDGPVFSGPQILPWICTTSSNGLGAAGLKCHADTVVQYFYRPTGSNTLQAYNPQSPPSNVSTTTNDRGETVPFIVRQETGTQNRGIYRLAVLHDPSAPFEPWDVYRGWNQKLHYPFGASCGTQYTQGPAQSVQNVTALGRGFMVATSSLNVLGNNCNTVLSAETMMMLKEYIVDHFGEIRYTFGTGVSGGSIGQHMIANAYPGLLQGITTGLAYPDTSTTGSEVFDCHLLLNYFIRNPHLWANPAQQTAVSGHGSSVATCAGWEALFASVLDPETGCGPVPTEDLYHPTRNPAGVRCTYQDFERNVWGLRPQALTGPEQQRVALGSSPFARYLFNNKGVMYGRAALAQGLITPEQYVHLNENIGSFDVDFDFVPERTVSDPGVPDTAYRTGRINDASNLDRVAIIDTRGAGNWDAFTIHTMHHSFALKERLAKAHGTADNHVLWRGGAPGQAAQSPVDAGQTAFDLMDAWLTAVEADAEGGSLAQKILRNRPAAARDACYAGGVEFTDKPTCDALWPYYGSPRIVAGGPTSHDLYQCRLKPFDAAEEALGPVPFTAAQKARLEAVFADGVCDWSVPSQGHTATVPWLSYAGGPGGSALGVPPVSQPLT